MYDNFSVARGFVATIVLFLTLMWFISAFMMVDQDKIYKACRSSGGVQQIITSWIDPSINGMVTAVCKNGRVVKVR